MEKEDISGVNIHPITIRLLSWYSEYKRELPWRNNNDSYQIWISEVILQQTRIDQGIGYYLRFLERFPNVASLASASEEEVLKVWQGLGYYSRARNLHQAARQIITQHNGILPSSYNGLISLKGVGAYTAAAVASIAFGLPHAVLDGNVFRVLTRLFAIETAIDSPIGRKMISEIAQSLLPEEDPGSYNQAIMDFGALICTPLQPRCNTCVLQESCMAYTKGDVTIYPIKERKTKISNRYFHYFHILQGNHTYLQKRNQPGIWRNLYEFPLIETMQPADFMQLKQTDAFRELFPEVTTLSFEPKLILRHQLTHQHIHTRFYQVEIPERFTFTPPSALFVTQSEELHNYPVSRLMHKYLETI